MAQKLGGLTHWETYQKTVIFLVRSKHSEQYQFLGIINWLQTEKENPNPKPQCDPHIAKHITWGVFQIQNT